MLCAVSFSEPLEETHFLLEFIIKVEEIAAIINLDTS